MLPYRPKQSPSPVGAEGGQQHAVAAAHDQTEESAASSADSTSQSSPSKASSATRTTTGDKRKRGDGAGEPGDGIKRQMIALPFRGRAAVAVPSYQEQQLFIGSEVQTSDAQPRESPASSSSPIETQSMSEMQVDATEGRKFLGALFSVVSMNRMLRQRWELYEDCRGKYRRRCDVVESFEMGLEELERKRDRTTVSRKHMNEIVEYRNQLEKFAPGRDVLKEETSMLLREYDALHDEVDASVEGLFAYGAHENEEEDLHFLTKGSNFWEVFKERRSTANVARMSARAKLKAIEDERLAIRNRIERHFEQTFLKRLASSASKGTIDSASLTTSTTEEDLRRLSELLLQQRDLKYKEKYTDAETMRSQSGELLKVAERALVDAGLLEPDWH